MFLKRSKTRIETLVLEHQQSAVVIIQTNGMDRTEEKRIIMPAY